MSAPVLGFLKKSGWIKVYITGTAVYKEAGHKLHFPNIRVKNGGNLGSILKFKHIRPY